MKNAGRQATEMPSNVVRFVNLGSKETELSLASFIHQTVPLDRGIVLVILKKTERYQIVYAYVIFELNADAMRTVVRLNGSAKKGRLLHVGLVGPREFSNLNYSVYTPQFHHRFRAISLQTVSVPIQSNGRGDHAQNDVLVKRKYAHQQIIEQPNFVSSQQVKTTAEDTRVSNAHITDMVLKKKICNNSGQDVTTQCNDVSVKTKKSHHHSMGKLNYVNDGDVILRKKKSSSPKERPQTMDLNNLSIYKINNESTKRSGLMTQYARNPTVRSSSYIPNQSSAKSFSQNLTPSKGLSNKSVLIENVMEDEVVLRKKNTDSRKERPQTLDLNKLNLYRSNNEPTKRAGLMTQYARNPTLLRNSSHIPNQNVVKTFSESLTASKGLTNKSMLIENVIENEVVLRKKTDSRKERPQTLELNKLSFYRANNEPTNRAKLMTQYTKNPTFLTSSDHATNQSVAKTFSKKPTASKSRSNESVIDNMMDDEVVLRHKINSSAKERPQTLDLSLFRNNKGFEQNGSSRGGQMKQYLGNSTLLRSRSYTPNQRVVKTITSNPTPKGIPNNYMLIANRMEDQEDFKKQRNSRIDESMPRSYRFSLALEHKSNKSDYQANKRTEFKEMKRPQTLELNRFNFHTNDSLY